MFNWFKKKIKLDEKCKKYYKYASLHPYYDYLEFKEGGTYACSPCKIDLIKQNTKRT